MILVFSSTENALSCFISLSSHLTENSWLKVLSFHHLNDIVSLLWSPWFLMRNLYSLQLLFPELCFCLDTFMIFNVSSVFSSVVMTCLVWNSLSLLCLSSQFLESLCLHLLPNLGSLQLLFLQIFFQHHTFSSTHLVQIR